MSRLTLAGFAALAAVAGVTLGAAPQAFAQTAQTQRDLTAPARHAVNQVVYASTSTSAAAERALDARINEQRRAIEALLAQVTQAGARNESLAVELATEQGRYVTALAERDRAYAMEIAVLRGAAEDIASTPEGLAALERFNAGDELGALLALDRLRDAHGRARQVRNNIESAAEARNIAALALEARNRGRLDTAAVIARYEEVARLDADVHSDWVALGRLYIDHGSTTLAAEALDQALALSAPGTREVGVTLYYLSLVHQASGDLLAARTVLERALQADLAIAGTDLSSIESQRDVAADLVELGDVAFAQGDRAAAISYHRRHLDIVTSLARRDTTSASLQRDVAIGHISLGDDLMAQGGVSSAREHYDIAAEIARQLVRAHPDTLVYQTLLGGAYYKQGDALSAEGNRAAALSAYQDSLSIDRLLVNLDPSNFAHLEGLAGSLDRVGILRMELGDLAGAEQHFVEMLALERSFVSRDSSSMAYQRGLAIALNNLGEIYRLRGDFRGAYQRYEESLAIRRHIASLDSTNIISRREVGLSLERMGNVLFAMGNASQARPVLSERYEIAAAIAQASPSDTTFQHDLTAALWHLALVDDPRVPWTLLVRRLEEMDRNGVSSPGDRHLLQQARRYAAQQGRK